MLVEEILECKEMCALWLLRTWCINICYKQEICNQVMWSGDECSTRKEQRIEDSRSGAQSIHLLKTTQQKLDVLTLFSWSLSPSRTITKESQRVFIETNPTNEVERSILFSSYKLKSILKNTEHLNSSVRQVRENCSGRFLSHYLTGSDKWGE